MVGFGQSIIKSQRDGWEVAYLDYKQLKSIVNEIEHVLRLQEQQLADTAAGLLPPLTTSNDDGDNDNDGDGEYAENDVVVPLLQRQEHGETGGGAGRERGQQVQVHHQQGITTGTTTAVTTTTSSSSTSMLYNFLPTSPTSSSNVQPERDLEVLKTRFFTVLKLQIEKISLFTLQQQGKLATAIGYLRQYNNNENDAGVDGTSNIFDVETSNQVLRLTVDQDGSRPNSTSSTSHTSNNWDLYCTLGVELLHLLRFICINSIGVRKILKKYNKIFDKRDLSHYYYDYGKIGDDYHIQQLAYSSSIVAIQSSLQHIALIEQQKQIQQQQQQAMMTLRDEHASAASFTLSLYRFQCIMNFGYILRGNAETLQKPFWDFLSKKAMVAPIVSKKPTAGGGTSSYSSASNLGGVNLGGINTDGGKQAMYWLLHLKPEDLLLMSQTELENMWCRWSGVSGPSSGDTHHRKTDSMPQLPSHRRLLSTIMEDEYLEDVASMGKLGSDEELHYYYWGGVNSVSMVLNLLSTFLYTVNYYIIAPTANHYAIKLGYNGAFGATLVGASSLSAIFAAFLYSLWYTKSTFQSSLIFSSICGVIGNLLYAVALSCSSDDSSDDDSFVDNSNSFPMTVAIVGRILCGLSSAEVINRQLISTCVDFAGMTQASALFVAASAIGMSIGPLLAGILELTTGRNNKVDIPVHALPAGGIIYNHVTSPGFVMALLWFLELVALIVIFREPERINGGIETTDSLTTSIGRSSDEDDDEDGDDDWNLSDDEDNSDNMPLATKTGYGSIPSSSSFNDKDTTDDIQPATSTTVWGNIVTTCRLIFQNAGLPITFLIFGYIEMTDEVLITSCSMIVRRYFGWHGNVAGFLIASLGALVLPAHFVVEKASHYLSERRLLHVSAFVWPTNIDNIFCFSGTLTHRRR